MPTTNTWDEMEARRRVRTGPPLHTGFAVIPPIPLMVSLVVAGSQEQPEQAQPETLDAVHANEHTGHVTRKSGGDTSATDFVREAVVAQTGDLNDRLLYSAVEAEIRKDIAGIQSVFFDETDEAYLYRYRNGKPGKLFKRDIPRRVQRMLSTKGKRAA